MLRDLVATDIELAAFERVCAVTGCRVGEAAALRFDDLLDGALRFDEAVRHERKDGETIISIGPTKSKNKRIVAIDDTTAAVLEAWISERGTGAPHELLFPGEDGKPAQPQKFAARWKRACKKRGAGDASARFEAHGRHPDNGGARAESGARSDSDTPE